MSYCRKFQLSALLYSLSLCALLTSPATTALAGPYDALRSNDPTDGASHMRVVQKLYAAMPKTVATAFENVATIACPNLGDIERIYGTQENGRGSITLYSQHGYDKNTGFHLAKEEIQNTATTESNDLFVRIDTNELYKQDGNSVSGSLFCSYSSLNDKQSAPHPSSYRIIQGSGTERFIDLTVSKPTYDPISGKSSLAVEKAVAYAVLAKNTDSPLDGSAVVILELTNKRTKALSKGPIQRIMNSFIFQGPMTDAPLIKLPREILGTAKPLPLNNLSGAPFPY